MRWQIHTCLGIIAVSTLCAAQDAMAQREVPGIQIGVENWLFIPTLQNGEVETFVGLLQDPPIGQNITSMWFTRNADETWSAWGWENQDQSKAIGYVKSFLALSDDTDSAWPIEVTPVDPEDHPHKRMVRGVFEDDPLADVVATSTDPEELLDFLVSVGWEAAGNPVIGRCEHLEPWLMAMVEVVQQELIEPGSALFDLPDDTICQGGGGGGGGGGGIICTPRTISSVTESCTSAGWGAASSTLQQVAGGCLIRNSWSATVTYTQTRRTRFIYANCTTCVQVETRTRTCTARLAEVDDGYGPVPCGGGVPAVYVAAAPSKAPCDLPAANCLPSSNWGPWGMVGPACP